MNDPNAPHRTDANVEPEREHTTHEPEAAPERAEASPEAPRDLVADAMSGEDPIRDDIMRAATDRANALLVSYLRKDRQWTDGFRLRKGAPWN